MSNDAQIQKLQQAITAQEALRGILPDEQIETTLAALQTQLTTLSGDGNVVMQGSDIEAAERNVVGSIAKGGTVRNQGQTP